MSMLSTLAKVAVGVVVVKGVSGMMKQGQASAEQQTQPRSQPRTQPRSQPDFRPGEGSVFGGQYSPGGGTDAGPGTAGGLQDILGQILGGAAPGAPAEPAARRGTAPDPRTSQAPGGSLGDLLGQILGGGAAATTASRSTAKPSRRGGLGGALDDLSQMSRPAGGGAATQPGGGSFGDLLNQSFGGEPERQPTRDEEDLARLFLRAMLQAAKVDGKIDAAEKQKILGSLGEPSREEMEFINAELARPVDIQGLAGDTPRGAEGQVYMMSVMGIDLDSRTEAEYLHGLATALGIGQPDVNAIHARLGVPPLYS